MNDNHEEVIDVDGVEYERKPIISGKVDFNEDFVGFEFSGFCEFYNSRLMYEVEGKLVNSFDPKKDYRVAMASYAVYKRDISQ